MPTMRKSSVLSKGSSVRQLIAGDGITNRAKVTKPVARRTVDYQHLPGRVATGYEKAPPAGRGLIVKYDVFRSVFLRRPQFVEDFGDVHF